MFLIKIKDANIIMVKGKKGIQLNRNTKQILFTSKERKIEQKKKKQLFSSVIKINAILLLRIIFAPNFKLNDNM